MRPREGRKIRRTALLLAVALVFSGCMQSREATITPLPAEDRDDLGLGPGVRPLSSGPGYKGSPSWGPGGERIAFTTDGYVVEKPAYSEELGRRTTKDFGAEEVEWLSANSLAILEVSPGPRAGSPSGTGEVSRSIYRASAGESLPGVREMATDVLAMSPGPGGEGVLAALEVEPFQSTLALTVGGVLTPYTGLVVEGRITGLSVSPDGNRAALAVRPGERDPFEIHVFDLQSGTIERLARLDDGLVVFGAPQWTERGIYYVAGTDETREKAGLYELYHVPPNSDEPERAPGVGEDFTASSLQAAPDGERLAVVGRLNPNSPTNLYVLEMGGKDFRAVTTNEDMEIKTGPEDLDWAPDGESLAIVARGPFSGTKVKDEPAGALLREFYNLYEVPVGGPEDDG